MVVVGLYLGVSDVVKRDITVETIRRREVSMFSLQLAATCQSCFLHRNMRDGIRSNTYRCCWYVFFYIHDVPLYHYYCYTFMLVHF